MPFPPAAGEVDEVEVKAAAQPEKADTLDVERSEKASEAPNSPAACTALAPFASRGARRSRAAALRERILGGLAGETADERRAALDARLAEAEARLREAEGAERAKAGEAEGAMAAYEASKSKVEAAIEEELALAGDVRTGRARQATAAKVAEERRGELFVARKKHAMLEVLKANRETVRQLQEQRAAAMRAAEEFKQNLREQRKRMFDAGLPDDAPVAKKRRAGRSSASVVGGVEATGSGEGAATAEVIAEEGFSSPPLPQAPAAAAAEAPQVEAESLDVDAQEGA